MPLLYHRACHLSVGYTLNSPQAELLQLHHTEGQDECENSITSGRRNTLYLLTLEHGCENGCNS